MELKKIEELQATVQADPNFFFENVLGVNSLEDYQRKINDIVAFNERTAISACHNVGKSWTLARLVLWFSSSFPQSKVITTAPTFNQVKNILWSEIRSAYSRSRVPLGGTMLQTEWQISKTGDWFAMGFTSRNDAGSDLGQGTSSSFQGFHAPGGVLIVFDEATGVGPGIWTMAEGLLTSPFVKFVAIGNPTSKSSDFFKCFSDPSWAKVSLSCFDSPNLQVNGIDTMDALNAELKILRELPQEARLHRLRNYKIKNNWALSTSWVMGRALTWGTSHPLFVSKVLGKFPDESDKVIMPLGIVEEAQRRERIECNSSHRKSLGVDVARLGSNLSVMCYLHGPNLIDFRAKSKCDATELVGEIIRFCDTHGWPDSICIDCTGVGGPVYDMLKERQSELIVPLSTELVEVHFGSTDFPEETDKARYVNLKAKLFDDLGKAVRECLTLNSDDIWIEELPTIEYFFDSRGKIKVESKDEYTKRTGRKSPDHADALALAWYGQRSFDESGSFTSAFADGGGTTRAGALRR